MRVVIKEVCDPEKCRSECVVVCPQNKKGKVAIEVNGIAKITHKNCIECYRCITACPLQAITTEEKKKYGKMKHKTKDQKEEIVLPHGR